MRKSICLLLSIMFLAALAAGVSAGETGHYVSGVEGIKGASVPGPGVYYRIYNVYYAADDLQDRNGHDLAVDFDVTVLASAHRLIWVTPYRLFGADFFLDMTVPIVYTDLTIGAAGIDDLRWGLGDVCFEPFGLSWHGRRFDAAVGAAVYAPLGRHDPDRPASPGKDFWSVMLTLGATVYLDAAKTWSASILSRYEMHSEKDHGDVEPGDDFHFEWGIGKMFARTWEAGLAGYCHWQITDDKGDGVNWDPDVHDRVYAAGPEIAKFFPGLKLRLALRGLQEFGAVDRPEGRIAVLDITKIF